jgi:DNA-binding MarR family transcriptional regulator
MAVARGVDGAGSRSRTTAAGEHGDHVDRLVAQWRRLRPDFDAGAMEVVGRIFRASRFLEAGLAGALGHLNLNRGEFDVLASLLRAGSPNRLTPSALSGSLLISNGTMTYRIDRLEETGMVRRRPDPKDRRTILVELTRNGRVVAERALAATLEAEQRLTQGLSEKERAALAAHLRVLLASLERD